MEELINPFKQNSKQELINPFKSSLKEKELPKKEIKSSVKELGLGFVSGFDNPFYTAAGKINTTLNKILSGLTQTASKCSSFRSFKRYGQV